MSRSSHHDPSTFNTEMYPLWYATYALLNDAYTRTSLICATLADQLLPSGLRNKVVLDVGCGYGTTTQVIAGFAPFRILAIDSSEPITRLMRHVCSGDDYPLLRNKQAQSALGKHFSAVREHLRRYRAGFEGSVFCRNAGKLDIEARSSFDLGSIEYKFEAIIGNHFLHWPIGTLRDKTPPQDERAEHRIQAIADALSPIAHTLVRGGIAVFSTMESFVEDDIHPDREEDIMRHAVREHPALKRFEQIALRFVQEQAGLTRGVPATRPKIIQLGSLGVAAERASLHLEQVQYHELVEYCDPLEAALTGTPMLLGWANLPWEKLEHIMQEAYHETKGQITAAEYYEPIRVHNYTFAFRKI